MAEAKCRSSGASSRAMSHMNVVSVDTQTYREADVQRDRHTERHRHRQTDIQTRIDTERHRYREA